jgi:flavin reductase (DIM6/NTAB) family NADH-FMN oxidoreductase RutF
MSQTQFDLADQLRTVMADVATPVAVVTAYDEGPRGSTVSAFTSLSMDPPMVLVALSRSSDTLAAIRASGRFGLNVLASEQHDVARQFASRGGDKFAGVPWSYTNEGARIDGSAGWVACEVAGLVDGGDHVVVTGLVIDAEGRETDPLTYHRRAFGTHIPLIPQ